MEMRFYKIDEFLEKLESEPEEPKLDDGSIWWLKQIKKKKIEPEIDPQDES
ncbi:MAG: hypothetical protein OH319_04750 [Candidatus Parvarchaeota archaeon]|nr:hypothetical protein [Candidatus Jingweiarchaeum tengchongense]MCW1298634.1 hypothetical protein [Candidatus Jingweiarchaeum tengchongense]MCW1300476.1 hypothetical protein [Candidatus Jingweiarchaeum tengchongense]MCW1304709.1 hypothetical protein [Candidatus Jingweiarchaeum tengchongense]MCW1306214.1 hypothetical protein [Candidatus Jingweiarchaeum tengchongense]